MQLTAVISAVLAPIRIAGSDSGKSIDLIHEKKISSMKDLLPLLEQVAKWASPC